MAELLLERGANPNAAGKVRKSVLSLSYVTKNAKPVMQLKYYGERLSHRDDFVIVFSHIL